jgi:hypothetical protein
LAAAALSVALTATAQAADPGITDNEITIGLFAPMSGPLTAFGLDALRPRRCGTRKPTRRAGSTAARSRF